MIGAFEGNRATAPVLRYAVALLVLAGLAIAAMPDDRMVTFGGSLVVDGFAKFLKILVLIGSAGTLLMSGDFLDSPDRHNFEYPVLILLSTTGILMLISAADLTAFISGLMMSLALYVVAFDRDNARSTKQATNPSCSVHCRQGCCF
jgi:NADH-quinone oxidoreductase subunit N